MRADFSPFLKKYPDLEILGDLKSGKEADLYEFKTAGKTLALKIYKPDFLTKSGQEYRLGEHIASPALRRSILKKTKKSKEFLQNAWIEREFYLLKKLHKAGIDVPEPVDQLEGSLLMEFLGDENGPAPRLMEADLNQEEAEKCLQEILQAVEKMWQMGIVHGDLSAYNILYWQEKPYLIDFPQAIDLRVNPKGEEFWRRDMRNLQTFFQKWDLVCPQNPPPKTV